MKTYKGYNYEFLADYEVGFQWRIIPADQEDLLDDGTFFATEDRLKWFIDNVTA